MQLVVLHKSKKTATCLEYAKHGYFGQNVL